MGQSCSCLDQSHPHSRRRSSSSSTSLQGDATARAEGLLHQPSKAIEASVVKRNPRTLDHESAYTAFVYKGMEHPPSSKKTEASGVSEVRADCVHGEVSCAVAVAEVFDGYDDLGARVRHVSRHVLGREPEDPDALQLRRQQNQLSPRVLVRVGRPGQELPRVPGSALFRGKLSQYVSCMCAVVVIAGPRGAWRARTRARQAPWTRGRAAFDGVRPTRATARA